MITLKNAMLSLAAGASVLALASSGLAQDAPPRGGRGGPPGAEGRGPGPGGPGMRGGDPAQREQRLRERLAIRAEQEGALRAFLAATAPPANPPQRPDPQTMRGMTTPQRLDQQIAMERQRLAEMQARAEATKRFYAALDATQKQTFDQSPGLAGPGGRGGRGGPGGRGPRGGGPGGPGGPGGGFGAPNQGFQ